MTAADTAANDEHGVAMTVIRAAVAVFVHGAPELRHRQYHDVRHAIAEIADERRNAARQIVEPTGKLTLDRSLVDMSVPSAEIRECHLEADARFGQLRNLLQRLPERA